MILALCAMLFFNYECRFLDGKMVRVNDYSNLPIYVCLLVYSSVCYIIGKF